MTDNLLTKGIITMNFLEERIMKDGVVKEGNILKVDNFLNHQMDVKLFKQMGEEFKRRFAGKNINKITERLKLYSQNTIRAAFAARYVVDCGYYFYALEFYR